MTIFLIRAVDFRKNQVLTWPKMSTESKFGEAFGLSHAHHHHLRYFLDVLEISS